MKQIKGKEKHHLDRQLTPGGDENLVEFFRLLLEIDQRTTGHWEPHANVGKITTRPTARQKSSPIAEPNPDSGDSRTPVDIWVSPDHMTNPMVAMPVTKSLSKGITVRLSPETLKALRRLAHERGIGPTTLIRMWIMERIT